MSSAGVVSTERDGGSTMWDLKGTLVSMVRVFVESEERRRLWVWVEVKGRRTEEREIGRAHV